MNFASVMGFNHIPQRAIHSFVFAQQYIELVGDMTPFIQGCIQQKMLITEAEPWAPMSTNKKKIMGKLEWLRGESKQTQ